MTKDSPAAPSPQRLDLRGLCNMIISHMDPVVLLGVLVPVIGVVLSGLLILLGLKAISLLSLASNPPEEIDFEPLPQPMHAHQCGAHARAQSFKKRSEFLNMAYFILVANREWRINRRDMRIEATKMLRSRKNNHAILETYFKLEPEVRLAQQRLNAINIKAYALSRQLRINEITEDQANELSSLFKQTSDISFNLNENYNQAFPPNYTRRWLLFSLLIFSLAACFLVMYLNRSNVIAHP
jgi:hypothetical protein